MDDGGYDPHSEEMMDKFNEWAERLAEGTLAERLEHVPDTVALLACLQFAARKVAIRRDIMTVDMAKTIFSNMLDDLCEHDSALGKNN